MNKEQIAKWRQDLHRIPELELELPKTKQYILDALADVDCEIFEVLDSAVLAWFDFGREKTIALRTDMDALPVKEETGAGYQSIHLHCMHACGHDGHMAMMLGVAHALKDAPVNVLLIFQPGEENPGGARLLVKEGILQKFGVSAIFGMHLWPNLKQGQIGTRPGALMAQSAEVDVTFTGRASHAAKYKEGIDALEAAATFLTRAYAYEKSLPEDVYRLLRFGKLTAGTIRNVVADTARLEGTLRAFEPEIFLGLKNKLFEIANGLEKETGVSVSFHFSEGYPAVLNDSGLAESILEKTGISRLAVPEMISEDFSWYQQEVPGVFFFLGTGTGIPLHAANFDFDSGLPASGTAFFLELVNLAGDLAL